MQPWIGATQPNMAATQRTDDSLDAAKTELTFCMATDGTISNAAELTFLPSIQQPNSIKLKKQSCAMIADDACDLLEPSSFNRTLVG